MKIRHAMAIVLSGVLWMGIGVFLLFKGFSLLLHPVANGSSVLLSFLQPFTGRGEAPLILVSLGLVIGFLKGRLILSKTATRIIRGIISKPNPFPIKDLYSKGYLLILGSMCLLGMTLRWVPIAYDLKGVLDVAVGSALINGSAFYFRYFAEKKSKAQ